MNDPLIVALDQGTSSCRAFAVDPSGAVRAQRSRPLCPRRTAQGFSEYTAEELYAAQKEVLTGVLDQIGPENAVCLAVCSQRSTIVLWDKSTGRAVAPVLTWEDGRAQLQADSAPLSQADVHAWTGLFKTPYFSAPKIAWCLTHTAQARQAAQRGTLLAAPVATYFIWKLTQGHVFATDPALAQRTLLWNMHSRAWSPDLCRAFGVPATCLPSVQPPVGDYGAFLYKGVSIPITVCAADQQAALAYHQVSPGQTRINYGTGAFVLHPTGERVVVLPGLLSSVAYGADAKAQFLLEGPVFAAGSVLQWLQAQGLLPPVYNLDEICTSAQNPVQFLPAFGGLGAPYWDYQVGPVIEGLSPHTRAADFVAGALQGVAHLVADIVAYLAQNGQPCQTIQVSGGLTHIAYLLQFQADMLQQPLEICPDAQSTVLGAALLAARNLGWNTAHWAPQNKRVYPRLPAAEAHTLRARWNALVARARQ